MGARRNYTQDLLKAQRLGRKIYASCMPLYRREDGSYGEWPVEYKPRSKNDPKPWLAVGTTDPDAEMRMRGSECHFERRYTVERVMKGFEIRDAFTKAVKGFETEETVAHGLANELNRRDRATLMGTR